MCSIFLKCVAELEVQNSCLSHGLSDSSSQQNCYNQPQEPSPFPSARSVLRVCSASLVLRLLKLLLPEVAAQHHVAILTVVREKEAALSLPSAKARKTPGAALNSRGCALLADSKLMHLCDQSVIGRRGVHDQVQLAGQPASVASDASGHWYQGHDCIARS